MTRFFVIWQNRHLYKDDIHCLQLYLALRCLDGHSSGSFLVLHWLFLQIHRMYSIHLLSFRFLLGFLSIRYHKG